MATAQVDAQLEAQRRLRLWVVAIVSQLWNSLTGHDERDIPIWLGRVLPVVAAAQRQSVTLTDAYLAGVLDRQPVGIDPDTLIGSALRNGADPAEVYRRPFVTTWSARNEGKPEADALNAGLARAKSAAAMDVALAQREAMDAVGKADGHTFGYKRVANPGACAYCRMLNGVYVKLASAMPLHNYCGCTLEPLSAPHPLAKRLPSGVKVEQHGELGPVITDPGHEFTGEGDIQPTPADGELIDVTDRFSVVDTGEPHPAEVARMKEGLAAIERVHRLPANFAEGRKVEVYLAELTDDAQYGGQHQFRGQVENGKAVFEEQTIRINLAALRDGFDSSVHETAHALDLWGLGDELPPVKGLIGEGADSGFWADTHPDWAEWRKVVEASGTGFYSRLVSPDYAGTWRELWARSYEQWIGLRTGDDGLAMKLARLRAIEQFRDYVFTDEEFGPIAEALDNLFRKRGLLVSD